MLFGKRAAVAAGVRDQHRLPKMVRQQLMTGQVIATNLADRIRHNGLKKTNKKLQHCLLSKHKQNYSSFTRRGVDSGSTGSICWLQSPVGWLPVQFGLCFVTALQLSCSTIIRYCAPCAISALAWRCCSKDPAIISAERATMRFARDDIQ